MPTTPDGLWAGLRDVSELAAMAGRLGRDLPGYLRAPISHEVALAALQERQATRAARLLSLVEQAVYARPHSPYARLLRNAGCELGDLRSLITQEGIEGALRLLAARGVYLTFDELKGRRDAVRGSQRFIFSDREFENPLCPPHLVMYTSGSRGTPGRVGRSLEYLSELAESIGLAMHAHGLERARHVIWLTAPVAKMLMYARLGHACVAWLHPMPELPSLVRAGMSYVSVVGRLGGYRFPPPTFMDLHRPTSLVRWLGRARAVRPPIMVSSMVSSAVRTATIAVEEGISLEGVTFHIQGEPITESRREPIERAGASAIVNYGSVEIMGASYGCATPSAPDDTHLFHDRIAMITRRRSVTDVGPEVDALLFTSISPLSARVLLNAEMGDYARVEERPCDCELGALGLRTHLSDIRSFEKLTGEGMTVVRTNLLPLLEHALPARFGGSSLDYQLVEVEGADSATRLVLRVHPSIGPLVEGEVRDALLEGIAQDSILDTSIVEMWRRAGTVTISREPPLASAAGKILPFQIIKASAESAAGQTPSN
jgi:hypothetical protein